MPGVSRDGWITTEAIATALVALEQLPAEKQPSQFMLDLRRLLAMASVPFELSLHLAQASAAYSPMSTPQRCIKSTALSGTNR